MFYFSKKAWGNGLSDDQNLEDLCDRLLTIHLDAKVINAVRYRAPEFVLQVPLERRLALRICVREASHQPERRREDDHGQLAIIPQIDIDVHRTTRRGIRIRRFHGRRAHQRRCAGWRNGTGERVGGRVGRGVRMGGRIRARQRVREGIGGRMGQGRREGLGGSGR
jgi:hypothetical protein